MMTCSSPADCEEIERRHATGDGLLIDDGASRGNLFSGEADAAILTVSRMSAEKRANPGYRAFFANGFNVTRVLVLFAWEVILERSRRVRQPRRDVRPRGERTRTYALLRAGLCVAVRDLIVFGVLTDMMRGRPAVYATFSSYDEVAHHSGLERVRHAGGAAQARPALRAHRSRPPLRAASLQAGGALRPRPDPGRDVQAAQRLRPGRARGALDRERGRSHGSPAATRTTRPSATPSPRPPAERRRRRRGAASVGEPARGRAGLRQPRPHLPDGGAPPPDARGDRGAPPAPAAGAARASAHRLPARPLARARRRSCSARDGAATWTRTGSRARTRWRRSPPTPPRICGGPTGSSTSPTSWSTASTTPSSSRGARSRS